MVLIVVVDKARGDPTGVAVVAVPSGVELVSRNADFTGPLDIALFNAERFVQSTL